MRNHNKNAPWLLNFLSATVIVLIIIIITITIFSDLEKKEILANIYTALGALLGLIGALLIFEYQLDNDRQKEYEQEEKNSKIIIEYTLNTTKEVIITIKQQCDEITNLIKDIESDYYLNLPLNEVATLNIERLKSIDTSLFYKAILLTYKGDDAFAKYASLKACIDFYIMAHKSLVETNHDICKDQHTEGLHIKGLINKYKENCTEVRSRQGIEGQLSNYSAKLLTSQPKSIGFNFTLLQYESILFTPLRNYIDKLDETSKNMILDTQLFKTLGLITQAYNNFEMQNKHRISNLNKVKELFEITNNKAEKIIKEISENTNTKIHEIEKQIIENNHPPHF